MDSWFSKLKVKCKHPHPGYELSLSILFPMMKTVMVSYVWFCAKSKLSTSYNGIIVGQLVSKINYYSWIILGISHKQSLV